MIFNPFGVCSRTVRKCSSATSKCVAPWEKGRGGAPNPKGSDAPGPKNRSVALRRRGYFDLQRQLDVLIARLPRRPRPGGIRQGLDETVPGPLAHGLRRRTAADVVNVLP